MRSSSYEGGVEKKNAKKNLKNETTAVNLYCFGKHSACWRAEMCPHYRKWAPHIGPQLFIFLFFVILALVLTTRLPTRCHALEYLPHTQNTHTQNEKWTRAPTGAELLSDMQQGRTQNTGQGAEGNKTLSNTLCTPGVRPCERGNSSRWCVSFSLARHNAKYHVSMPAGLVAPAH